MMLSKGKPESLGFPPELVGRIGLQQHAAERGSKADEL